MIRRTITFDADVNRAIQTYRANLIREGKEKSYTAAVNEHLRIALNLPKKDQ